MNGRAMAHAAEARWQRPLKLDAKSRCSTKLRSDRERQPTPRMIEIQRSLPFVARIRRPQIGDNGGGPSIVSQAASGQA